MNRTAREEAKSVKRFERSNGPDIALDIKTTFTFFLPLHKNIQFVCRYSEVVVIISSRHVCVQFVDSSTCGRLELDYEASSWL